MTEVSKVQRLDALMLFLQHGSIVSNPQGSFFFFFLDNDKKVNLRAPLREEKEWPSGGSQRLMTRDAESSFAFLHLQKDSDSNVN